MTPCSGLNIFFPPAHERREAKAHREALAISICEGCPQRVECNTGAHQRKEEFGIWGGEVFDKPNRSNARVARRPAVRPCLHCGKPFETTHAKNTLCSDECREARRLVWEAEYRQQRKGQAA